MKEQTFITEEEIETQELYKDLLVKYAGKYILEKIDELNFREIVKDRTFLIVEEVQKIILKDYKTDMEKIMEIEDLFIKNGLKINWELH